MHYLGLPWCFGHRQCPFHSITYFKIVVVVLVVVVVQDGQSLPSPVKFDLPVALGKIPPYVVSVKRRRCILIHFTSNKIIVCLLLLLIIVCLLLLLLMLFFFFLLFEAKSFT